MTTLSDVLYARAMEDMSAKSTRTPSLARLHARAHMAFEVKLEQGGMAKVSVSKYCAGYTLHCTARIESPVPGAVFSGFVHSSDGGGTELENVGADQRLAFQLSSAFWRSTTFTVHLRTTPALPAGTVLKVCMDVDY